MQTVYIKTTIPSYLAAHPSSQLSIAADQRATHDWWNNERGRFRLYTSIFTLDEAGRGDAGAAARRLAYLQGIPELDIPPELPRIESDNHPIVPASPASCHGCIASWLGGFAPHGLSADLELHAFRQRFPSKGTDGVLHVSQPSCPDHLHTGSTNPTEAMTNELIDEVREARAALAAEHGYDRQRIYEWARAAHTARKQALRNPIPSDPPHSTSEAVASGEPLSVSK